MAMLKTRSTNLKMLCSPTSDSGKKKGDIYETLLPETED